MIFAAADPGSTRNACAVAAVARSRSGIWIPVYLREWIPTPGAPLDLRLRVLPEACADLMALGCARLATDAHASADVRLACKDAGMAVVFATSDAREHWRHVAAVIGRRQLSLAPTGLRRAKGPPWPDEDDLKELRAQLGRVRRELVADGWRITIPEVGGLHGDEAVALARSLWLAKAADADFDRVVKVDVEQLGGRSRYEQAPRRPPATAFSLRRSVRPG